MEDRSTSAVLSWSGASMALNIRSDGIVRRSDAAHAWNSKHPGRRPVSRRAEGRLGRHCLRNVDVHGQGGGDALGDRVQQLRGQFRAQLPLVLSALNEGLVHDQRESLIRLIELVDHPLKLT